MRRRGHIVPLPSPAYVPSSRSYKTRISPNSFNIALLARPEAKSFHWAILATPADAPSGVLFHAEEGPEWKYFADAFDAVFEMRTVAVLQLDEVPPGLLQLEMLTRLFAEVPLQESKAEGPDVARDCRVWVKDAVRLVCSSAKV